jgi:hypothetical protein
MKKLILALLFHSVEISVCEARKYPFDMEHSYEVKMVRVADKGYKFIKVWGTAGSIKKAMDRALQDAVAACIFTGVPGKPEVSAVPPICSSSATYEQNKKYFDTFFKKGVFMQFVKNVNSNYPSGENNIKVKGGRKVCLYVLVNYDALRKKLENDNIIKSLDNYF